MKRLLALILCLVFVGMVYAEPQQGEVEKKTPKSESICPISKISDNNRCMDCHVLTLRDGKPAFAVKEIDPHSKYRYPNQYFKFVETPKGKEAFFLCKNIEADIFDEMFDYLARYPEVKHLTIEMHTPGGSIYQMWRVVSLMDDWKNSGRTIKCIVRGFCASAGFIVLNNATPGMRFVAKNSEIMWHEVQSMRVVFGFDVSTPSDKEDEARILRHFQNNGNGFLAEKGKMNKDKIDEMIRKKEWWMTGKEAVDFGFADALIK